MSSTARFAYRDLHCLLNATCAVPKHTMPTGGHKPMAPRSSDQATAKEGVIDPTNLTFLPLRFTESSSGISGRLVYWADGVPAAPWTAFVSSRLGQRLDSREAWFRALRTGCARLAVQETPVLNVEGTTAFRFLERATELFATPRIDVLLPTDPSPDPQCWWQRIQSLPARPRHTGVVFRALLSPRVDLEETPSQTTHVEKQVAEADLITLRMADAFLALHVRNGGHIHHLLRHKLTVDRAPPPAVQLAIGANLNTMKTQEELLQRGAVGWYLYTSPPALEGKRETNGAPAAAALSKRISASLPRPFDTSATSIGAVTSSRTGAARESDDSFLTHCTRRRVGAWPDQTKNTYLDDLILNRSTSDHSPLAALQRIVVGRRLIASGGGIRGGTNVVSFTSVPVEELQELRVFRAHRGRWDFEPYGICIRRSALTALAATPNAGHRLAPVAYGGEEDWQRLESEQKPFFQKSHSESKSGRVIDWSAEQEWRFLGDVDLNQIKPTDAFLFVPNANEANTLQDVSPWPVLCLKEVDL